MQQLTAIITGVSQGIRRAVALDLARQNYNVYLIARSKARLDAVAQECRDIGGRAVLCVGDVTKSTDWGAIIDVNLKANMRYTQLLLPHLSNNDGT